MLNILIAERQNITISESFKLPKCNCASIIMHDYCYDVFVWFDSLRPINNLSAIKGHVFMDWARSELGLMFLLKDTTQWRRWGSNQRPLGLMMYL